MTNAATKTRPARNTLAHLAPAAPAKVVQHLGANNAFIGACDDFDALIAKLQAARAAHFGVDALVGRNWAEAGSVIEANRQIAGALAFLTSAAA